MADYSFAGQPIVQGDLLVPLVGAWTSDCYFADPGAPLSVGQTATLSVLGVGRVGTVVALGAEALFVRARIVGGAGKLDVVLGPRDYKGYQLAQIARDCLSEAGEVVGEGWDSLDVSCTHWTRPQAPCRESLRRLSRLLDGGPSVSAGGVTHWRTARDGSVVLLSDTWPTNSAGVDRDSMVWPNEGLVEVYPADGSLDPGQSVTSFGLARRVQRVEYRWSPEGAAAHLWYL